MLPKFVACGVRGCCLCEDIIVAKCLQVGTSSGGACGVCGVCGCCLCEDIIVAKCFFFFK
jgi:hypothetical protein